MLVCAGPGVVSLLPEGVLRPVPSVDRARWLGRATIDHHHRLPQGGLSRLVLDHPQVRPRCDRLDHLPWAIVQDHRQGESWALEQPYRELLEDLPSQDSLNVDETGHKRNGQQQWTWCFRAALYTLFKIDPTRSAEVLIDVLGAEFDGVLGCDYFSAYRRYHREFGVVLQLCVAHTVRTQSRTGAARRRPLRLAPPLHLLTRRVGRVHGFAGSAFSRPSGITWRISSASSPTMTRSMSNCKIRCFSASVASSSRDRTRSQNAVRSAQTSFAV